MKKITSKLIAGFALAALIAGKSAAQSNTNSLNNNTMENTSIHYRTTKVNGLNIFYREAGKAEAPTILLLHGYPTSSHMFRNLIPILKEKYHVIAPDLPGFGYSDAPDHQSFIYTFDNVAGTVQQFIDQLGLKRFAIYIFDYGAPVGLRIALANPEKITGIISQNGNAYEEGLSHEWNLIQKYWKDPSQVNREALRDFVSEKATWFQYHEGVSDPSLIAPEAYILDQHFLDRPGNIEIQLDLVKDYRTNLALYPKFHEYFKKYQPKALLVWGNKDPYFLPAGACAYQQDLHDTKLKFYDTGHFALETNAKEIGADILEFMATLPR
ncbi:alpha/beta hydrolase [Mucilaginibacter sp. JRF]|uniref:alpha/beta fold hydrolase n=1 Tax=Mucilaginibacter sp. JRF TaxID=2780088 RepID=UPI001882EEB7|nr:alpha/beta hydrolase [Mucilaginibacter sp. JRF]MBE9583244.1 alpha/beta hydrolase [Mucilaginibacter sp. JRF]